MICHFWFGLHYHVSSKVVLVDELLDFLSHNLVSLVFALDVELSGVGVVDGAVQEPVGFGKVVHGAVHGHFLVIHGLSLAETDA